MKSHIKSYLELCKVKVALLSSFSAGAGFLFATPKLALPILIVVLGVFLLACGSLVLNQYQERDLDAVMTRTCMRPIPSGRVRAHDALFLSGALLFAGCAALLMAGNILACVLGLLALVWYNGIYTYLKRKSAFAAVPCALIGAIPPAIGWITGGGAVWDPRLLMLCFFFFMWQVPHSWLFIMHYRGEYEKAGIPTLARVFSPLQMQRIIFSWIFATAVSGSLLPATGTVHYLSVAITLVALSSWFAWYGIEPILRNSSEYVPISIFKKSNHYLLAVLVLLSLDKLSFLTLMS